MQITLGKVNEVKINNLKIVRKLIIISEEEFKARVKQILDLQNQKSFSHPWFARLGSCSPMISNVKSIWRLFKKFVNIVVDFNKIVYFGFVESNLFINHLHFIYNPLIPHYSHTLYPTCILLQALITSWSTFGPISRILILFMMNIYSPRQPLSPNKYSKYSSPCKKN